MKKEEIFLEAHPNIGAYNSELEREEYTKEEVILLLKKYAEQSRQADVSGSLQEHKEVIKELMETYIINVNEDGEPKASITDIMKLIDRAVKLVGN